MFRTLLQESLQELLDRPSALVTLSYPASTKTAPYFFSKWQHYEKGPADAFFVVSWVVFFWILREVVMKACLAPLMRCWLAANRQHPDLAEAVSSSSELMSVPNGHANGHVNGAATPNGVGEYLLPCNATKDDKPHLRSRHTNGAVAPPSTPPLSPSRRRRREEKAAEKKVIRFSEQGWSLSYCTVYWLFGCYIHYHSPSYPFQLDYLWKDWPHEHFPIPGPVKFYYLTQLAWWINQLVVLNVETKRKDHTQMMTHHIVTSSLIILSYRWNFTRVGCLILVLLDLCDILLPVAKCFKYLNKDFFADLTFGTFVIAWLITREILYTLVVKSAIYDAPRLIPFAEEGVVGVKLSRNVYYVFCGLLSVLVVLLFGWLAMIVRVIIKVVKGASVEDVRSDDEDECSESDSSLPETPSKDRIAQSNKPRRRNS